MLHRLMLTITLLCPALLVCAQDSTAKRNEIFTKLNPFTGLFLNNYSNADFALGYKRYTKNFNLRVYASYWTSPDNYFSNYTYYDEVDSSITWRGISQELVGFNIGIERITKWPRKLRIYYGLDAGVYYIEDNESERLSYVGDSMQILKSENSEYFSPNISPFIGLRYDISPRFAMSLEIAPRFSYSKPVTQVDWWKIHKEYAIPPQRVTGYSYSQGNVFSYYLPPLKLWLGFRL